MSRLLTLGWETGDVNEGNGVTGGGGATQSVVNSTPTPRAPGSYCLKFTQSSTQTGIRTWTLAAAKTEIWLRVAVYISNWQPAEGPIISLLDSTGISQITINWHGGDQLLRVRSGVWSGTALGTSTFGMANPAWHLVEVRWKTTTTTSSTDGVIEVWIDGGRAINLTAVDSTATSILNVQGLVLGLSNNNPTSGSTSYEAYDDLAVNDTAGTINNGQIGDGRVVILKPSGPGSNTGQTRGGTDSGANWSQVDEFPPSMTDYVYASTVGTRDTYAIEDIPSGVTGWGINSVDVIAYGQNSDAVAGSLAPTVVSGATTNEGTATPLSTTPAYVHQQYEIDPNTGAAWTATALNALEAGTTVR
jgi:hypothetical protein